LSVCFENGKRIAIQLVFQGSARHLQHDSVYGWELLILEIITTVQQPADCAFRRFA
jgi:lantibiotic modifying enzyme